MAISGVMGSRSDAALPELRTTFRMQPTNDSIMYLTPCSFSSELRPVNRVNSIEVVDKTKWCMYVGII